jgi:transcriptional regulator
MEFYVFACRNNTGQKMYIPPPYLETRRDILIGAIRARSFGTLITTGAAGIRLSHVPFAVTGPQSAPVLIAHLARANPQWQDAAAQPEAVAAFLLDDGYISPNWYPTKKETGKVVPTWNYVAVEARGAIEWVDSAKELLDLVNVLTDRHEQDRPQPWSTADAPADYTAGLLRGIVGLRLHVRELTGAWKLDQKKRASDRAGAAAGLDQDAANPALAKLMRSI